MTEFLQLGVAGLAVGSLYALVALGFVIILKATGVINFAQGALVMLGAYLGFTFQQQLGLPFPAAVVLAIASTGLVAVLLERIVLRRMVGKPLFAVIMVTIGLGIVIEPAISWGWGFDRLALADPWGLAVFRLGSVGIAVNDVVRLVSAAVLLTAFFVFFRYSRLGVMMRATASDPEAALAQGISSNTIYGLAWGVAGAVGAVAGLLLSTGARGIDLGLASVALLAIPAIIVGGLDSPLGAVVGGLVVGLIQAFTQGYERYLPEWTGDNIHTITPYLLLLVVLVLRPYGLFGTREVERL